MLQILKYIGVFALGGAVGGAGAFLFLRKKEQKRADDQIDEMSRHYIELKKKLKDDAKAQIKAEEDLEKKAAEINKAASDAVKDYARGVTLKAEKIEKDADPSKEYFDYTSCYGGQNVDQEYEENKDLGAQATREHTEASGPVIVSEDDYEEYRALNEREMRYYMDNGVLTVGKFSDEEEVDDFYEVDAMIGDALSESEFTDNDEECLFVVNEKMGTKYRIIKMYSAYSEG